jgi:neutral ceramidase
MDVIEFPRVAPSAIPEGRGFRAGAAITDLTPPMGTWTAGWGPALTPRRAVHFVSRLYARVLVLDDGEGERVALIAADLHAGSRYLCERIATRTASEGFHVGRIVLVGAHNHAGPGNLYGSPYFDAFSTSYPWVRGFHRELADDYSERIAVAVKEACASLRPALVGHASVPVWNWTVNRSLDAALNNFPGASESEVRGKLTALRGAPVDVRELERLAVDPRLQLFAAVGIEGEPIGAFATFAGHAAMLAREHSALGSDWFGAAQHTAEGLLHARTGVRPVIGLGAGAIGDVDPRPPGMTLSQLISQRQGSVSENLALVRQHGSRLGSALVEAFELASKCATQPRLSVRFAEPEIRGDSVPTEFGPARLPDEARIGASTLAGSELGPGYLSEGLRDDDPANEGDPHWPKVDDDLGMSIIQPVLDVLQFQPTRLPLRLVQIGDVALAGVSGEPTTWFAHSLSELLLEVASGVKKVMVAGTCGDYSGYFTSEREYEQQHYEGSSTLWGRFTERWLQQAFNRLATVEPVVPDGIARFVVEPFTGTKRRRLANYVSRGGPMRKPPKLQVLPGKLRISGGLTWNANAPVPLFEWGEWLRVETGDGKALHVEPQVLLDELMSALWWSVELVDWKDLAGRKLCVVLDHHEGKGRFELNVPG